MTLAAHEPLGADILAVDLDDLTLGRLKQAARGSELTIAPVSPDAALERVQLGTSPFVVLLEWAEDREDDCQRLCAAVRAAAGSRGCHIVALGGMTEHTALDRALAGGADDVLCRPFGAEVLLPLRKARSAAHSSQNTVTPRAALDEALKSSTGGEVVVRAGAEIASIHVQGGHIVWANLSSVSSTMDEVARHAGVLLDPELVSAVKEECRSKGAHFMEVLIDWGFIERDTAREAVRSFLAEKVKLVLDLPKASALFLPKTRAHSQRLRFGAHEILSSHPSTTPPPSFTYGPPSARAIAALSSDEIAAVVNEALRLDGALSAAVLDRKTGACLFTAGGELDTGIAWSQLTTLAALGEGAEDVLGCAGKRCFITRPLLVAPSLALFVVISLSETNVGLSRASVAQIAGRGPAARG